MTPNSRSRRDRDRQGVADAMFNIAWTRDWRKEPDDGDQYFDRVSDAYRAAGDERGVARVLFIRGQMLLRNGQLDLPSTSFSRPSSTTASSMTSRTSS